jgi:hypothetical protein
MRWAMWGGAVLLGAVAAAGVLVPFLLDSEAVRERVMGGLTRRTGVQVYAQTVDLSLFPRPRVALRQATLSLQDAVQATMDSLTVYPALLPLLRGHVSLSRVLAIAPDVRISLSSAGESGQATSALSMDGGSLAEVLGALVGLASDAAEMVIEVENGTVRVNTGGGLGLSLWDIRTRLTIHPNLLHWNWKSSVQREGQGDLLRGMDLQSSIHLAGDQITLRIRGLRVQEPDLRLAGDLSLDRGSGSARLRVEGTDMDVVEVRRAMTVIGGEWPLLPTLFSIVRAGKIPRLTVETQGRTLEEMGATENLLIRGNMSQGQVFVPGPDLEITEARGEVVIARGILEGKALAGRLENARGRNGSLRVGLRGERAPLSLDVEVETDAAQIPRYLRRLLKDETIRRELARVSRVRGQLSGRLVVKGRVDEADVSADVSSMRLAASYPPLPYPVEIRGGRFAFDGERIQVSDMRGSLGSSSFDGLTAGLDLVREPHLEISSARASLELEEIYPWLAAQEGLRELLQGIRSAEGRLDLRSVSSRGPLMAPETWEFRVSGAMDRMMLEGPLLPGKVIAQGLRLDGTTEKLAFQTARVNCLDASLRFSGTVADFWQPLPMWDVSLDGNAGPVAARWVAEQLRLPGPMAVRGGFSISNGHVIWDDPRVSFSGKIKASEGPEVLLTLTRDPDLLEVSNLTVRDEASDATVSLRVTKGVLDLGFRGRLHGSTLEGLLQDNAGFTGEIRGDFRSRIPLQRALELQAEGTLDGEDLTLPWGWMEPFRVDQMSLTASNEGVDVTSAAVRWGEIPMAVSGKWGASETGPMVDMKVSVEDVAWDQVQAFLGSFPGRSASSLRGTVRVQANSIRFAEWVWRPVQVEVVLEPDEVEVRVNEASVCGISTPGVVRWTPAEISVDLRPQCSEQSLDEVIACVGVEGLLATGQMGFQGEIGARGRPANLLLSAHGNLEFTAEQGRLQRYDLLGKVFGVINASNIWRGKMPDLTREGIVFDELHCRVDLQNGRLRLTECAMDGPAMKIAGQGDVDLMARELDIRLLLAPFRSADSALEKIPIAGHIAGGTVLSIPVRISGSLRNPTVRLLSPSAVASGLLGIMERTAQLPVKLVEPLGTKSKKKPETSPKKPQRSK